jgi:class 3 adenylate cyclase
MAERILLLPAFWAAPPDDRTVPAFQALIDQLAANFEVKTFTWPTIKGGPSFPPTWQGAVDSLIQAMSTPSHVVDAGSGASLVLMALGSGRTPTRSFVAAGMSVTPATLRALDLDSLAEAASLGYQLGGTYQIVRALMEGASEDEWTMRAEQWDAAVDPEYLGQFWRSFEHLDLLRERPQVSVPALYLETPLAVAGYQDMKDIFLYFVPEARVGVLKAWPTHLQDPDTGRDFAGRITEFIHGLAPQSIVVTILFTDIVDSTVRAAELGDHRWGESLAQHRSMVRRQISQHSGREIDTAGDGFLVAFESPARAVRCAQGIVEGTAALDLDVRAGIHAGECEVSGEKLSGLSVHIAARVLQNAGRNEVLVSSTVRELLGGSEFTFEGRGSHELKGVPGEWRLFAVIATDTRS